MLADFFQGRHYTSRTRPAMTSSRSRMSSRRLLPGPVFLGWFPVLFLSRSPSGALGVSGFGGSRFWAGSCSCSGVRSSGAPSPSRPLLSLPFFLCRLSHLASNLCVPRCGGIPPPTRPGHFVSAGCCWASFCGVSNLGVGLRCRCWF